jgi:hypothetical protein
VERRSYVGVFDGVELTLDVGAHRPEVVEVDADRIGDKLAFGNEGTMGAAKDVDSRVD